MKNKKLISFLSLIIGITIFYSFNSFENKTNILSHTVDLKKDTLNFYWKNEKGEIYNSFQNLKGELSQKDEKLVFAINGGMFKKGFSPQGLYIEKGITLSEIDTITKGYGNFYLQPNGIFYITNNKKGVVCETKDFKNKNIKFATQSEPMLLINGKIHKRLMKGSKNLNSRNGVGILSNGQLLFAMSKEKINFHSSASYFKSKGCENALYLDGFISKTYLPEKKYNKEDGKFGIIIGQTITK